MKDEAKMKKSKQIINRELSWLSFNHRVLQEAVDPSNPLIERIRFLGIFSNNLDEFFKVRVASVKRMLDYQIITKDLIGGKPLKILQKIQETVIDLQNQFDNAYQDILKGLAKENIFIINENQLNEAQGVFVRDYFHQQVLPILSPIMLHNLDEIPRLTDKTIYLAIILTGAHAYVQKEYALIEIPAGEIPRFFVLPQVDNKRFIMLLEDVVRYCLKDVFSIFKFDRFEAYTIKLTRDAELDIDNDLSKSFLEKISHSVIARKKGQPVRFIYDKEIPEDLLSFLKNRLELDEEDNLIPGGRYHNFKDFMTFPNIGGDRMVYPPLQPVNHPRIKPNKSILNEIAKSDLLLHYPYHNFNQYINLIREAAIDPHVVSIKITLYRVAEVSRVIMALINAARNGKEVTVIFELQARFNEESNIRWSKKLQEVGAQVIFGVPGLKIHAKLTLISRREKRRLVHYACVGTGNFHEGNAAVYVDCTLCTIDRRITAEVRKLFDFFEHPFRSFSYKHLIVSPLYMRRKCNNLVENEIKNAREGKKASIILKLNSIVDNELINKLYRASNAGVKIKLIIRGICSLIPGIPGLSENIEVISIVGRFLEHSRFMIFHNDGDELYYLSSADWMIRNMDHRVEVACPIYDPKLQQEIKKMINLHLADNVKARVVNKDQNNEYRKTRSKKKIDSQQEIYKKITQHLLR